MLYKIVKIQRGLTPPMFLRLRL